MNVGSVFRRSLGRLAAVVTTAAAVGLGACTKGDSLVEPPDLPGQPPAVNPQLRAAAFILDINKRTGQIKITQPKVGVVSAPSFSPEVGGPSFSIVGGDVVDLTASNFNASAVGASCAGGVLPGQPGKVCVTLDLAITNKLASVTLQGPTVFPAPPPGTTGPLLFPFEITVTSTPGGATGGQGQGNDVIVENPAYGAVQANAVWDGAPHNFFNDNGCPAGSNDCFRWEEYPDIVAGSTTSGQTVGFFTDPTVGTYRVRLLVASDLVNSGAAPVGDVAGTVSSPQIGNIASATVTVNPGGFTGTTGANGSYAIGNVTTGAKTVAVSNLPAGCTVPASQNVTVNPGATTTVNFSVTCQVPSGTVSGTVTSSLGGGIQNVAVTVAPGGATTTNASGAYSVANVPVGSGTVALSNIPANCTPPAGPSPYTIASAGQVATVNFTLTCTPPPPNSLNGTWTTSGNTASIEFRVNVTSGNIGSTQFTFNVNNAAMTYTGFVGANAPILGNPSATNPPATSITAGGFTTNPAGLTGNLGVITLQFDISGVPSGTVINPTLSGFGALNNSFTNITSTFQINVPSYTRP